MPEIDIRDNPKLRSFFRNVTELTFTGFVWGVWVYMLLPLVNILMWILGFQLIETSVIEQMGYKELIMLLSKMGWIILAVFLIFRLWGYYNYVKFGRKSRRKGSPPVSPEQLAAHFRISASDVEKLQMAKEITWE